jgi:hemolysin activation/secretion protein
VREVDAAQPNRLRIRRPRPVALAGAGLLALVAVSASPAPSLAQGVPPGAILPPLTPPPLPDTELSTRDRLFVREVRVVGSTVFSPAELAEVTTPYVNRVVSVEELEALRVALTRLYVDRGYVNSGALLTDQVVGDGVVTYRIVEGRVSDVEIAGTWWFRPGYLRRRLARAARPPLSVNALQEQIQIMLDDPRIRRLNAELAPGVRPGESILKVAVEERQPFRLTLSVDNYQSPSQGAERGFVLLEDLNLTGNGDVLALSYGRSEGVEPMLDFSYALPVNAWDTTLAFRYRRNTSSVITSEFAALGIDSDVEIFTLGVRQPVYRTPAMEVAVGLLGERLRQETTLLGEPFSPPGTGAVDGESVATVLRASQEWLWRTQNFVLAARSRFSVGIDALGSTIHSDGEPDSRFFAWLGQAQWVQRLPVRDSQLVVRADAQIADDALLPVEQIAIGGRYSVRGYRENTLVRDNAVLASVELRVPVVRNMPWAEYLELAPFYDYGRGWNAKGITPDPKDLSSVGIGLRWGLTIPWVVPVRPQFEIYWGHPLRKVPTPGGDIQDDGIHFQFLITGG